MDKKELLPIGIVILTFVIAFMVYPSLPERVPSHWNAAGEIDGYMPRLWGTFLFPIITGGVWLLMWGIPKIAVFKKNIAAFDTHYYRFRVFLTGFFAYMFILTLASNFYEYRMNLFLVPAFSVLFLATSPLLKNAKRNFFIGIRTPWTLSSDTVWAKTHKLGAKTVKWVALIILGAAVYPTYFVHFFLIPVLAWAFGLIIYSYLEFRKEKKTPGKSL